MAITAEKSTQIANVEAVPAVHMYPDDLHGKLKIVRFNFTQGAAAGDAGSTQQLVKLPPGRWRVMLAMSRVAHSAFGAARTLDLGWQAYTGNDGVAVAADPNGLDDGNDVSALGSFTPTGTVGGEETYLFDNKDDVTIEAQCNDGTIPIGATLDGYIVAVAD